MLDSSYDEVFHVPLNRNGSAWFYIDSYFFAKSFTFLSVGRADIEQYIPAE
jgi:hypothetical protein